MVVPNYAKIIKHPQEKIKLMKNHKLTMKLFQKKKKKKINEVGINNPSRAINLLFHIHVGVCNFFFFENKTIYIFLSFL